MVRERAVRRHLRRVVVRSWLAPSSFGDSRDLFPVRNPKSQGYSSYIFVPSLTPPPIFELHL